MPDDTVADPLLPAAVVPVLSSMEPLSPEDSAFALEIVMAPVVDDALAPVIIDTAPPTSGVPAASPALHSAAMEGGQDDAENFLVRPTVRGRRLCW